MLSRNRLHLHNTHKKQQFALHASTCGAKRFFVDGTDGLSEPIISV
jgi:hypothetical protein